MSLTGTVPVSYRGEWHISTTEVCLQHIISSLIDTFLFSFQQGTCTIFPSASGCWTRIPTIPLFVLWSRPAPWWSRLANTLTPMARSTCPICMSGNMYDLDNSEPKHLPTNHYVSFSYTWIKFSSDYVIVRELNWSFVVPHQPQSDLYGLIQVMIVVFGEEPPVFSRPTTQPPYQAFQATGPPNRKHRSQSLPSLCL